jgi:hypothetical protein
MPCHGIKWWIDDHILICPAKITSASFAHNSLQAQIFNNSTCSNFCKWVTGFSAIAWKFWGIGVYLDCEHMLISLCLSCILFNYRNEVPPRTHMFSVCELLSKPWLVLCWHQEIQSNHFVLRGHQEIQSNNFVLCWQTIYIHIKFQICDIWQFIFIFKF